MQAVLEYLKQHETLSIEHLAQYVRFPSVSAQPRHQKDMVACAEWVVKHCRDIGLDVRLCETNGHPIVLAKTPPVKSRGAKRPRFLVYGPVSYTHLRAHETPEHL